MASGRRRRRGADAAPGVWSKVAIVKSCHAAGRDWRRRSRRSHRRRRRRGANGSWVRPPLRTPPRPRPWPRRPPPSHASRRAPARTGRGGAGLVSRAMRSGAAWGVACGKAANMQPSKGAAQGTSGHPSLSSKPPRRTPATWSAAAVPQWRSRTALGPTLQRTTSRTPTEGASTREPPHRRAAPLPSGRPRRYRPPLPPRPPWPWRPPGTAGRPAAAGAVRS